MAANSQLLIAFLELTESSSSNEFQLLELLEQLIALV
jgi:hypothetical protein